MIKIKFLVLFAILFSSSLLYSQLKITGKIINQDKAPVEFIEVILLAKDVKPIISVLSDKNGSFSISSIENQYIIEIKQNAKILYTKEIYLTDNLDLGIINVQTIQMLKEVLVKTEKKIIEYRGDKLIFNVENSISASGGDVIDILKATPNLIIQGNTISMVGKSNVSVMLNDRIIQLSGEDLINMLKSISSENVSKIEVINSPSAKYDAEGNGDLINIVLKKPKNDSYNGNIKSSYTQAKYASGSFGGGLNYQKNKLTVISSIDFLNGYISPLQEYKIYYPNYKWDEKYNKKNHQSNNSQRIMIDYKVSKKTNIGIEYNKIFNSSKVDGLNESKVISTQLDSIINTSSFRNIKTNTNSINAYSITKLDTLGKKISLDFDYFNYDYTINNDFDINTYLSNGQPKPNRLFKANNTGSQGIKIYSSRIDFTLPLKPFELSIGAKVSYTKNDNETLYYNILSSQYILDNLKSNSFLYTENNNAIYASVSKDLFTNWYMQLGIRLENTKTKGTSIELNQINTNNYTKLFPSFYLSYKSIQNTLFSFNYSRRIERPIYNLLNPFRIYSTTSNYSIGNPFLLPYFSNNFKLFCSKNNFNHSLSLNITDNGIDQVTYIDATQNSQITKPSNFFNKIRISASENYSFQKLKVWQSNNGFTLFYSETKSKLKETLPLIKGWTGYFSSFNNFSLNKSKSLKAELNFIYQTSAVSNSYKTSPYYNFDIGIKYSILKNNFQFSLNINDIFKTSGITFSNNINNIIQEKYSYSDNQKIRFSLLYKFGKSIKDNKRDSSIEDEKNRVK